MDTIKMSQVIDHRRRGLLGIAAATIAAAPLIQSARANAQSGTTKSAALPTIKPGTNTSLGPIKQIDAGVLNVGYAEAGPADGYPVILLHGWPYDIYSFADVAPLLAGAGYRVIMPYLRGYGTTQFLSGDTVRNGQQAVVAVDIIALMDALKIQKAIIAGFDWGARTANVIAAPMARALQSSGLGKRLSDWQSGGEQETIATEGRACLVVSVLLRNRTRPPGLRQQPARFLQAHLAARIAEMELRRRNI
jgi:pimeloyl-ACP methyl ester carboxylesterase